MRIWREAVGMGCGDGWGVWYGVCVWLAFGIFFPLLRGERGGGVGVGKGGTAVHC